jgi:hypothetical protein
MSSEIFNNNFLTNSLRLTTKTTMEFESTDKQLSSTSFIKTTTRTKTAIDFRADEVIQSQTSSRFMDLLTSHEVYSPKHETFTFKMTDTTILAIFGIVYLVIKGFRSYKKI